MAGVVVMLGESSERPSTIGDDFLYGELQFYKNALRLFYNSFQEELRQVGVPKHWPLGECDTQIIPWTLEQAIHKANVYTIYRGDNQSTNLHKRGTVTSLIQTRVSDGSELAYEVALPSSLYFLQLPIQHNGHSFPQGELSSTYKHGMHHNSWRHNSPAPHFFLRRTFVSRCLLYIAHEPTLQKWTIQLIRIPSLFHLRISKIRVQTACRQSLLT
jgi:hypothetical protein